jgi:hypothetical protein
MYSLLLWTPVVGMVFWKMVQLAGHARFDNVKCGGADQHEMLRVALEFMRRATIKP